jgi:hypothetical protein
MAATITRRGERAKRRKAAAQRRDCGPRRPRRAARRDADGEAEVALDEAERLRRLDRHRDAMVDAVEDERRRERLVGDADRRLPAGRIVGDRHVRIDAVVRLHLETGHGPGRQRITGAPPMIANRDHHLGRGEGDLT